MPNTNENQTALNLNAQEAAMSQTPETANQEAKVKNKNRNKGARAAQPQAPAGEQQATPPAGEQQAQTPPPADPNPGTTPDPGEVQLRKEPEGPGEQASGQPEAGQSAEGAKGEGKPEEKKEGEAPTPEAGNGKKTRQKISDSAQYADSRKDALKKYQDKMKKIRETDGERGILAERVKTFLERAQKLTAEVGNYPDLTSAFGKVETVIKEALGILEKAPKDLKLKGVSTVKPLEVGDKVRIKEKFLPIYAETPEDQKNFLACTIAAAFGEGKKRRFKVRAADGSVLAAVTTDKLQRISEDGSVEDVPEETEGTTENTTETPAAE